MWLGCVKRLNDPDVTPQEVKKIRLILTSLKSYVVVWTDYIERIKSAEERMDRIGEKLIDWWEMEKNRARTEEEKAQWQKHLDDLKAIEHPEPYHIWPRRADKRKLKL